MTENQVKLAIGCMLHDIGKVIYRTGDGRNHSKSGAEYLEKEGKITDTQILECVKYHHADKLKGARVSENSYAYIAYYADNIAAAADRREAEDGEGGFDRTVPLDSVFNILNGNSEHSHYARQVLDINEGINYPTNDPIKLEDYFYTKIRHMITECLNGMSYTEEYVNSLLAILESTLSYIPSSTSKKELTDISLYDHSKITAALGGCIEQYLDEKEIKDYRMKLSKQCQESYTEKMFLLYSMDISGIQKFIYTISSEGALKGLRARSFYLEIMMEHIIDELLEQLSLSRANLIYSGGGHCYMLLPNTNQAKEVIEENEKQVNNWLRDVFDISLYVAGGFAECSANDLKNMPSGSYSELYRTVSRKISQKKSHRYEAADILLLNHKRTDGDRECKICKRTSDIDENNKCEICKALESMSGKILKEGFFVVVDGAEKNSLPLPGNRYLVADDENGTRKRMESPAYIRCYSKNRAFTGKRVATKLWVGDYTEGGSFENLAKSAEGIERIAVLRADVDNLGKTFLSGFRRKDGNDQYVTLSRTATLSRQLSLFFKGYINHILKNGEEHRLGSEGERNITIVYSGGDDVFLVGAWNEVIAAFVDIKKALDRFTQHQITISGGIEVYPGKYPIHVMAEETAELEELSKKVDGKNAITLFDGSGTYTWPVFLKEVLEEKYMSLVEFFEATDGYGKGFLYHLLMILRGDEAERFNRARYVYYLSRMEPEDSKDMEKKKAYREFSKKMYQWAGEEEQRRQMITAIYLYVYLNREREEE